MTSSVIIILYNILDISNADRYLLVEVGEELTSNMESNVNEGPMTPRRSISTKQLDEEAVPNANTNNGKQFGYRRGSGHRSFTWAPPPIKTTAPAPPPGTYLYQKRKIKA